MLRTHLRRHECKIMEQGQLVRPNPYSFMVMGPDTQVGWTQFLFYKIHRNTHKYFIAYKK